MNRILIAAALVAACLPLTGCDTMPQMPQRVTCAIAGDECSASRKIGPVSIGTDIDARDAKVILDAIRKPAAAASAAK
jgi:hypothetical protein